MARRTTVTLDDAVLGEAQVALGTVGIQDTVEKALAEAVRRHRLRDLADRMRAGTTLAVDTGSAIDRDEHWRS